MTQHKLHTVFLASVDPDARLQSLLDRYGIPVVSVLSAEVGFVLSLASAGLRLMTHGDQPPLSLEVSFLEPAFLMRLKKASRRSEVLLRAMGTKVTRILDATAGLGRDGVLLASRGFDVTLVERHPVMALMLADALYHFCAQPGFESYQLEAVHADAKSVMASSTTEPFEVIYIDPMFAPRKKSAEVKQAMRLVRALVGPDGDASDLLAAALRHATKRVVVKRALLDPPLGDWPVSFEVRGSRNRFDVYLIPPRD